MFLSHFFQRSSHTVINLFYIRPFRKWGLDLDSIYPEASFGQAGFNQAKAGIGQGQLARM